MTGNDNKSKLICEVVWEILGMLCVDKKLSSDKAIVAGRELKT